MKYSRIVLLLYIAWIRNYTHPTIELYLSQNYTQLARATSDRLKNWVEGQLYFKEGKPHITTIGTTLLDLYASIILSSYNNRST